VFWQVLQLVGGYYVNHQIKGASQTYGTFAVVIGLLSWLYLQAQLTLLSAEVDTVRAGGTGRARCSTRRRPRATGGPTTRTRRPSGTRSRRGSTSPSTAKAPAPAPNEPPRTERTNRERNAS
jgi:hypothetical protein